MPLGECTEYKNQGWRTTSEEKREAEKLLVEDYGLKLYFRKIVYTHHKCIELTSYELVKQGAIFQIPHTV